MRNNRNFNKKAVSVQMSQRANILYLQQAKITQDGERVVYWTEQNDISQAFNIPDKNTAFILLGKGTSITDAAVRKLSESGVLIGFCGSGGTPCFATSAFVFLEPNSEYRPTEYMQKWVGIWFDDGARLKAAKLLLRYRINITRQYLSKIYNIELPSEYYDRFNAQIDISMTSNRLLLAEAAWAKYFYKFLAQHFQINSFSRSPGKRKVNSIPELTNSMIDQGNYLAYGIAATALHTLGISFALPLLHGKTRRGALVFDIADLIKDAFVLPTAFSCGNRTMLNKEFRAELIDIFWNYHALDLVFDTIKILISESML
jgi:CRISP-associated protein Cas1